MRRLVVAIAFSVFAVIATSACSQGGTLTLESGGSSSVQDVAGQEFTNTSVQYATTTNGYKIQDSVGDFLPQLEQTSTTNNYKFYSTVQGQLVSAQ